jgi:hypothetical protein
MTLADLKKAVDLKRAMNIHPVSVCLHPEDFESIAEFAKNIATFQYITFPVSTNALKIDGICVFCDDDMEKGTFKFYEGKYHNEK